MAKICMKCGREFEDRSVRCPICKLDLASIEKDNSTERQRMQKARQDRQARYARGAQAAAQEQGAQARNTRTQGGQAGRQARSSQDWSTQRTIDENKPETWTSSYVSSNWTECTATLRANNLMAIDFLRKKEDLGALAYLIVVEKGLWVVSHEESISGYAMLALAMCYECKGRIAAFGSFDTNVSERQRQKEALSYLEMACKIYSKMSVADRSVETRLEEMIADFKSGMPLARIRTKNASDYPSHTIGVLESLDFALSKMQEARGMQTQEMKEVRDTQDGYRQSLPPQPAQKSKNEQKTPPGQAANKNRLRKYRIVIICTGILFGLLGFKCLVNGNFICCVCCVLCIAGTKKMYEKIYGVDYITSCSKCGRGIKGSFFDDYVTIRYKKYCRQCAESIPSCDKCKYHYRSYFYPRFGCCAHFNQYLQDYDNVCDYYEKGEPIHPDVSV